ncbi:MAG: hypothetical protein AAGA87_05920 [Pseudomonadota bacterium]
MLLLPTDIYIAGGVATVALTVLLLALLPPRAVHSAFRPIFRLPHLPAWGTKPFRIASIALLLSLVAAGIAGSTDPLANPLPLGVWVVWWIGFVALQGALTDLWRFTAPWLYVPRRASLRLPRRLGHAPACIGFLALSGFILADPAPADPRRLATLLAVYLAATALAVALFGRRWLLQCEPISVLMRVFRRIAPFARMGKRIGFGLWGWRTAIAAAPPFELAVFMVLILGSGSYDGLNETFWWLNLLGVNPLEYPGRSALVIPTLTGLVAANAALLAVFTLCLYTGLTLARTSGLRDAFCRFAPALLPIALGYHIAHYLTAFLVDAQWALKTASDPFATGANLFGTADTYVTTGFFNTQASVRAIWLTQAGAVVIGHVVSILLSHALALRHFATPRQALLSQIPLAFFMAAYTLFGLWLLASPRGA